MKTPPLLIFAALTFWGWQSHLLWEGALAGALIECSRLVKWRWELEDVDFNRIWSLCTLVIMVLFGYIFTTNDQGGGLKAMTHGAASVRNATISSSVAAFSVLRWLPLICFPFIAAQVYNQRPSVPLTSVSMALRIRRRRGEQSLAGRYVDLSYAYFMLAIFSAGIHSNDGPWYSTYGYFVGQAILILWALWRLRSGRFGLKAWVGGLATVAMLGLCALAGMNGAIGLVQRLDAKLFAHFFGSRTDPLQTMTSIGQIGELGLSPRIVIRLEPERAGMAPDYLREASYRLYHAGNQTWQAGPGANEFAGLLPEPDNSTWLLLTNKAGTATVSIACYLNGRNQESGDPEGVLPMPSGSCRLLNLPNGVSVVEVKTNKLGVVMATGSGLMIFGARYGSGATIDSPPDASTNEWDLVVPDEETNALEHVVAEINAGGGSDTDKCVAIKTFFARNFTYSTWQGPEKRSATNTPLSRFLLNSRSGHCEYFATATVLLLRKLGIPARYAVGYYVHETSGTGYVVRERDAHAWCLVWNREKRIWEDFDTTPPSWVAVEGRNASMMDALSDLRSWIGFQFERLRWRQANLRQYIIWTLAPVILVLLYYIIFQRRSRRRAATAKAAETPVIWPGHDSAFYQLENALAARGLPRQPQETLSCWLERVLEEPALADLRIPLRELLRLHYRYRFDPHGLGDNEKKSLVQNAALVLEKLGRMLHADH